MKDILPEQTPVWRYLEETVRGVLDAYGYWEIRLPIVESTELFKRSIGEVTDIVEKEMYTFQDGDESLTLRPEGTAGCVRAAIENGIIHNQVRKLWYQGPMFRHERPQKGRYRQFHQIGVEVFGLSGPDIDAELILLTARLWRQLGLLEHVQLQLNTLGSAEARSAYREKLVAYCRERFAELDEDSRRRLDSNPLRILDSKNPAMADLIQGAPQLLDHLDEPSREHFEQLTRLLEMGGVSYVINPRLVRGLDYYGRTVFEWVTDRLGAQGTVCAGGRYDGLVEHIGGRSTPAVGFAMGLERLVLLLTEGAVSRTELPLERYTPHAYFVAVGEAPERAALVLAERLRSSLPRLRLELNMGSGGFKAQIKRADKSGARFALVLGESELAEGQIGLKSLREEGDQRSFSEAELIDFLAGQIAS